MRRILGRLALMGLAAMVLSIGTIDVSAQPGGRGRGGRGGGEGSRRLAMIAF